MIQGTVITFWLRALRGTTLVQLHRDWAQGLFVWKALSGMSAVRHMDGRELTANSGTSFYTPGLGMYLHYIRCLAGRTIVVCNV